MPGFAKHYPSLEKQLSGYGPKLKPVFSIKSRFIHDKGQYSKLVEWKFRRPLAVQSSYRNVTYVTL